MDFLQSLQSAVKELIGEDDRPIVMYSSIWPLMREMGQNDIGAVQRILDALLPVFGDRTLLMPTFVKGYVDGICNLDKERSSTGTLTECYRVSPGVQRTLSAFFPFSVSGKAVDELIDLAPTHAWGEGSVYEWMEKRNACFLMLGTNPTQCSYLHRFEWLVRDKIDYRYNKTFSGNIIRDGSVMKLTETLYVRRRSLQIYNDFSFMQPILKKAGAVTISLNGISIAAYHARNLLEEALPIFQNDPLIAVKG